jgi:hypothetical protein
LTCWPVNTDRTSLEPSTASPPRTPPPTAFNKRQ